jgi:hypothetical protein
MVLLNTTIWRENEEGDLDALFFWQKKLKRLQRKVFFYAQHASRFAGDPRIINDTDFLDLNIFHPTYFLVALSRKFSTSLVS